MRGALLLVAIAAIALTVVVCRRLLRNARRKQLLSTPITPEWKTLLEKNVPIYTCLPEHLKTQLESLVNLFIAEKTFVGCGGQKITDAVKVTIAAQACLLLLNRKTGYFSRMQTIFVYPTTYVATDGPAGDEPRLGESWQNGPVVLAWNSVTGGANNIYDGKNVVFHEFSHQLDQEDGEADGTPILESRSCYATWARVLSAEYEALRRKTRKRKRSVLGRYGATAPEEFFAVATEAFFEKSRQMKKKHPELYDELRNYYKLDPAEWTTPGKQART